MYLNLKYFFSLVLLFVVSSLAAQVQFEIVVSAKEMGRKDHVQVEYVISGADKVTNFQLPDLRKWAVINGPSGSSQLYDFNGNRSSLYKYIYLLSPGSTGKLELPGTSVVADGKKISCKSITITVKKEDHIEGAAATPSYTPQVDLSMMDDRETEEVKEYDLKPGEDPIKKIRSNLFIKVLTSKKKCYVGEPVLVTYKLYTRLSSTSRVMKQPTFTGCSVNEMTTTEMRAVIETVNGKKYKTYIFRRLQLFPLQAGIITSTPAMVDNTVTFVSPGTDPRKLYYGIDAGKDYDLAISTEPFTIEVMPLPGNKIASIGNFEVFTKLKKDTIAANETNALLVTIVGSGNFKSVGEPEVQWPENIYHFDTKESEELDKLSFPLTGRRTYEIPFEVNAAGKIDIPPVSFSYFDPSKAKYTTVQSRALQLTVTPAVKTNIRQSVLNAEASGTGIRYLLYLLPIAFIIGGLIIWKMPKKKVPTAVAAKTVIPQAGTITVKPRISYNIKDKMDELIFIQDDMAFYSKARELARELISMDKGDQDILLQVLQDCNTVLYTPMPSTSRKEILDKLQRAIA